MASGSFIDLAPDDYLKLFAPDLPRAEATFAERAGSRREGRVRDAVAGGPSRAPPP